MTDAYICDGVRTAIGKHAGALARMRADDMAAHVIQRLLARNSSLDQAAIDDVIFGCANQSGEDNRNVARMALLLAGVPHTVPGETVNRLCASGLSAAINASRAIKSGEGELFIAGGVESMTRAPFVLAKADSPFSRTAEIFDTSIGWRFVNPKMKEKYGTHSMGETAENVAERLKISREDQDKFALASQSKATAAQKSGRFKKEIVPVEFANKNAAVTVFETDEFIRPDTTLETLAKLKPAFRSDGKGSVTAGNASGINDGAAALIIASEKSVSKYALKPKARIIAAAASGVEPAVMGLGPVEAVRKVLSMAKLSIDKVSVIELNEAFAAQCLGVIRGLELEDSDPRINPNGGAIALGHPLGMSGARLLITAAEELQLSGEKFAICTMCVGVGQGVAALIERV